ncbi:MAG: 4-fold beta flower protein, partial [Bacteroidota bacterium]
IPIYSSRGDTDAFLAYPYIFNRNGEWIGWVTAKREVYSVLGYYVGYLSKDPRILRKRATSTLKPRLQPPPHPGRIRIPANVPLAPLLSELTHSVIDVLAEEPDRLHTMDAGELRQDLD